MGLTPEYVPKWSAWHIVRELVANCMDADPDFTTRASDADNMVFVTKTVPRVAECVFLGLSSSRSDADKIGQFGEGLKLAALVATRRRNAGLILRMPGYVVEFAFRLILDERVLHARIVEVENSTFQGFEAILRFPGCVAAGKGKFLPAGQRKKSVLWAKDPEDLKQQIYCKGIWVCNERRKNALFHYNFRDLNLNRDRDRPSTWSLDYNAIHLIDTLLGAGAQRDQTEFIEEALCQNLKAWEHSLWHHCAPYSETCKRLAERLLSLYDPEKYCLPTGDARVQLLATGLGFRVLPMNEVLAGYIAQRVDRDDRHRTAEEVTAGKTDLEEIDDPRQYAAKLRHVERILDILEIPAVVRIFRHDDRILGQCLLGDSNLNVWLSEDLFIAGNLRKLLATLLHELAHVKSQAHDLTPQFQNTLDDLGGGLAVHIITQERHHGP
jgi:hypothetical protein